MALMGQHGVGLSSLMIRFRTATLTLVCLLGTSLSAQTSTTRMDERMGDLLQTQRELLALASVAEMQEEIEQLRPRLQTLVFDWEDFLRDYSDQPEGYIAYSMLLGNPLIDERERAKALLLKANSLDQDQPIVKNQLGKYLAEEGLPLQALPYFLAAVELEPEEPLYHYQIGQLLGGARSDFIQSGEWTAESIDTAMQHAFAEAVRLDPESLPYAYRYAESYYDLENPPWDEAMAAWLALEERVETPTEKQMMRLHQANVLLFQGELDAAEVMLQENFEGVLASQQERLLARLERLRNPPPPAVEPEVEEETVVAMAETPAAPSRPYDPNFVVPEFRPVRFVDLTEVGSAAVIDYVEEAVPDEQMPPVEIPAVVPEPPDEPESKESPVDAE